MCDVKLCHVELGCTVREAQVRGCDRRALNAGYLLGVQAQMYVYVHITEILCVCVCVCTPVKAYVLLCTLFMRVFFMCTCGVCDESLR